MWKTKRKHPSFLTKHRKYPNEEKTTFHIEKREVVWYCQQINRNFSIHRVLHHVSCFQRSKNYLAFRKFYMCLLKEIKGTKAYLQKQTLDFLVVEKNKAF